jgi:hypothetical protein
VVGSQFHECCQRNRSRTDQVACRVGESGHDHQHGKTRHRAQLQVSVPMACNPKLSACQQGAQRKQAKTGASPEIR